MTVHLFTKSLRRVFRKDGTSAMLIHESRTFCTLKGTCVGSDRCYHCENNVRRKADLRLPPWTIECNKKDEIQFTSEA
jgi:hypothetical protein